MQRALSNRPSFLIADILALNQSQTSNIQIDSKSKRSISSTYLNYASGAHHVSKKLHNGRHRHISVSNAKHSQFEHKASPESSQSFKFTKGNVDLNSHDDQIISKTAYGLNDNIPEKTESSALTALIQMTTSTMHRLNHDSKGQSNYLDPSLLDFYSKHSHFKKRRKTRTAFTNQQIGELERRFGLQKYLTPADRDQIAGSLNLSNAQVITWFQNRRAKMKREIDERQNDILAAKRSKVCSISDSHDEDDIPSVSNLPLGSSSSNASPLMHTLECQEENVNKQKNENKCDYHNAEFETGNASPKHQVPLDLSPATLEVEQHLTKELLVDINCTNSVSKCTKQSVQSDYSPISCTSCSPLNLKQKASELIMNEQEINNNSNSKSRTDSDCNIDVVSNTK